VSATLVICVDDFPRGEVSAKVGVMEFGLEKANASFRAEDEKCTCSFSVRMYQRSFVGQ